MNKSEVKEGDDATWDYHGCNLSEMDAVQSPRCVYVRVMTIHKIIRWGGIHCCYSGSIHFPEYNANICLCVTLWSFFLFGFLYLALSSTLPTQSIYSAMLLMDGPCCSSGMF